MDEDVQRVIVEDAEHGVVLADPARSVGWPANHCRPWAWGDEVLVGAHAVPYADNGAGKHLVDFGRPGDVWHARSRDGGATWARERHPALDNRNRAIDEPAWRGGEPAPQPGPIDFANPDTILAGVMQDFRRGASCYVVSHDRGRSWGPRHPLPRVGEVRTPGGGGGTRPAGVMARTDYDVEDARTVNLFVTIEQATGREGRVVVLRTEDGGVTWRHRGDVTPAEPFAGYRIMPSTVRLSPRELVTGVRTQALPGPRADEYDVFRGAGSSIEVYASGDNGRTWALRSVPVRFPVGTNSSPASLVRLADGRVVLTYAGRSEPYYVAARTSADGGNTWGPELIVRQGADRWDLGYVRSCVRADGKIVSVYYWGDPPGGGPRYLAASVWSPDAGGAAASGRAVSADTGSGPWRD